MQRYGPHGDPSVRWHQGHKMNDDPNSELSHVESGGTLTGARSWSKQFHWQSILEHGQSMCRSALGTTRTRATPNSLSPGASATKRPSAL
jgi:hypothetical protein